MFVLSAVIAAVLYVVDAVITVYFFILLASCLISWVNPDPYNPLVRILRNLTEPVLWRVRKWLPFTYASGLDFSPVVVMVALQALRVLLDKLLGPLAM
jgi:YggT family protein